MMMNRTFLLSRLVVVGLTALYSGTAFGQTKTKKEQAEAAAAEAAAAQQAVNDKLAAMEASQAAMETRLVEMQAKVDAAEQNQKTVEALNGQVTELNQKLDAATKENKAADEELKKEIASFAPGKGFTVKGPGESFLTIGGLLQTRIETTKDGSPNGSSWDWDSYIRRVRLMFSGQINKWINFFVETDMPNLGLKGEWDESDLTNNGRMFIQDAFLEVNIHPAIQIDLGLLIAPFSHHGMQGATSLMGMDYHGNLLKYPVGSNLVWRDAGIMFRGLFAGDHVEYRLALTNGVRGVAPEGDRNPDDLPRLTMRWTFNVFEPEGGAGLGGFFYDGLYLAKTDAGITSPKRILSFGFSGDWQPDLNVTKVLLADGTGGSVVERQAYAAAAWDAFFDLPLGERKIMSLNGQVNGYFYYYGDRSQRTDEISWYDLNGDTTSYTGLGLSSEIGFRYNWLQPLLLVDFYKSIMARDALEGAVDLTDHDPGDYIGVYGGFNAFVFAHAATFKLQAGAEHRGNDLMWTPSVRLQAQLLF
jgi:hypothetical protein